MLATVRTHTDNHELWREQGPTEGGKDPEYKEKRRGGAPLKSPMVDMPSVMGPGTSREKYLTGGPGAESPGRAGLGHSELVAEFMAFMGCSNKSTFLCSTY